MAERQISFGIILVALLIKVTNAIPVNDTSLEKMVEAQNGSLTSKQDQEMNTTEFVPFEGSAELGSGELVNCTCNMFSCSDCGWITNLLPNESMPLGIIQVQSDEKTLVPYLQQYFCRVEALKNKLNENMLSVSIE